MIRCSQTTSLYLNQYWPNSIMPFGDSSGEFVLEISLRGICVQRGYIGLCNEYSVEWHGNYVAHITFIISKWSQCIRVCAWVAVGVTSETSANLVVVNTTRFIELLTASVLFNGLCYNVASVYKLCIDNIQSTEMYPWCKLCERNPEMTRKAGYFLVVSIYGCSTARNATELGGNQ